MQVEIYTETTIKGPRTITTGKYAAAVVCQTTKGPAVKGVAKRDEWTTFHRSSLLAILAGLELLTKSCRVKVYTPDAFLVNMIRNGNLEKWKREEWRRPQDKELKNKGLWQQLEEQMQKHTVTFVYTKVNPYSETLKKYMEVQV